MNFERIKKVKLIRSLKGTEGGKPIMWLAGTVFNKDVKPFPPTIIGELHQKRVRSVIEVLEYYSEKVEPSKVETAKIVKERVPDIIPEDIEEEKPKTVSPRVIKRAII